MNREEAQNILQDQLGRYRQRSWPELRTLVEDQHRLRHTHYEEVRGEAGTYQVRVNVYWDDKRKQHLRVAGAIDDGGWRAFLPVTDSFIVDPDGNFIGE